MYIVQLHTFFKVIFIQKSLSDIFKFYKDWNLSIVEEIWDIHYADRENVKLSNKVQV